jgi:transmembrane 9 superfamily protein 2/4
VFGFLLLVYALLLITCAEISIVLTYFQLCAEDYRWWWRSMLAPGASGVYLYAYCIFYYMANLEVTGWVSQLLYFGYMGLVACVFTFITGATGFLATFWFVRTIYSAIKVSAASADGCTACGARVRVLPPLQPRPRFFLNPPHTFLQVD